MTEWADLGGGVSAAWLWDHDGERVLGLMEEHELGVSGCNGIDDTGDGFHAGTAWIEPTYQASRPHWTVEAGAAGDFTGLTLSPSILHRSCGFHGWIQDGKWVAA